MLAKDGGRDAVGSGEIRGRSGRGGMATVRLEVGGALPWLLPRAKRCWNRFRFDSISDFDSSVGPFGREVATVGGGAAAGTEEVSL